MYCFQTNISIIAVECPPAIILPSWAARTIRFSKWSSSAATRKLKYFKLTKHVQNSGIIIRIIPIAGSTQKEDHRHLNQFIAHAALDLVDEHKWKTNNMYLKSIDKFNQWFVSAFVTASQTRFVMVHDNRNDEGIRNFFNDVYEMFIKHSMNAFYQRDTAIRSPLFEKKAQMFGRKYLVA